MISKQQLAEHGLCAPEDQSIIDTAQKKLIGNNSFVQKNSTNSSLGIQRDFLSVVLPEVVKHQFYTFTLTDFWAIDDSGLGLSQEIIYVSAFNSAFSAYQGSYARQSVNSGAIKNNVVYGTNKIPTDIWVMSAQFGEVEESVYKSLDRRIPVKLNPIQMQMDLLKELWDFAVQFYGLFGNAEISGMTGLLNNANVTIDTTVLKTGGLNAITSSIDFETAVENLFNIYTKNNAYVQFPNRLIIPFSEYNGLGRNMSLSNTMIAQSRLQYLVNKGKGFNPNFEVTFLPYLDKTLNAEYGLNKNRYVLYNYKGRNERNVIQYITAQPTATPIVNVNSLTKEMSFIGGLSGVVVKRPQEMIYFDYA